MAGVAQAEERLSVNQDVAGSSPATRPEIVGMSSNWQDCSLWSYLSRSESSHPSFAPVAQPAAAHGR
jgi:hypothetical protein